MTLDSVLTHQDKLLSFFLVLYLLVLEFSIFITTSTITLL